MIAAVGGGSGGLDVVGGRDLAADGEALLLRHGRTARPRHGQRGRGVVPGERKDGTGFRFGSRYQQYRYKHR